MITLRTFRLLCVESFYRIKLRKLHTNFNNSTMEPKGPKIFSFVDYDVIGFDLDNCLCRYNLTELFNLEYEILSSYIIKKQKNPKEIIILPYNENHDFILKGLFLDLKKGNILKISKDGVIVQARHGTKELSPEEINCLYPSAHWNMTDRYIADPISVWTGEPAECIQALTDYFDLPVGLIFAQLVDNIDKTTGSQSSTYDIFPEILNCLHDMYDYEQYKTNQGGYYPALTSKPHKYILPCGENVIKWLKDLKKAGKKLFLLTGSNIDYASFIAEKSLGPDWMDIFDIKIFKSRKPGFWSLNRPFKNLENNVENIVPECDLKMGRNYLEGNYNELKSFLSKITNKSEPKVLYLGDNIIQDVYAPNQYCGLDTIAIVEEVESEGVSGYSKVESENAKLIYSETWGSFFTHNKSSSMDTIWKHFIMKHSKLMVPSISAIVEKSVELKFTYFNY